MVTVSMYFILGKMLRARYSTLEYTAVVYTSAALTSIALTYTLGVEMLGFTAEAWIFLFLLALVPMLGGHTLVNYVIGRLSLLAATVPILGEPVGATILAYIVLGEPITANIVAFMFLTLSGIALVLVWERRS